MDITFGLPCLGPTCTRHSKCIEHGCKHVPAFFLFFEKRRTQRDTVGTQVTQPMPKRKKKKKKGWNALLFTPIFSLFSHFFLSPQSSSPAMLISSSSSSLALRSIYLLLFSSFALFPYFVHVLFFVLSTSHCHTWRAHLSPVTYVNKRCVNRYFFSISFLSLMS